MPRINSPVDHMFRAGQISGKEWSRLSGKTQGWGSSHKMKSKMVTFEHKKKDEAGVRQSGHKVAGRKHIDGPDQGTAAPGAFSQPTPGGFVQGATPVLDGAKTWPAGAKAKKGGQNLRHQKPGSTDRSAKTFTGGDGATRQDRPSRLGSPGRSSAKAGGRSSASW